MPNHGAPGGSFEIEKLYVSIQNEKVALEYPEIFGKLIVLDYFQLVI